ncbi:MAG TPA: (Fe-S)-binding protein [Dehalococcoidia bacterium]|nr:(Fe-S)-binding protein [Dehalococcoidia bacterium]
MSNTTLTSESKMNLAKTMLKQMIDRRMLTAMEACVRCGICTESCHYYRSDPKPEHAPFYRAEQLRRLYRQFFDPVGRVIPGWFGAGVNREKSLEQMAKTAFADCTLCHRCTFECPFGVETAEIMRVMRSIATATGFAPEMLVEIANAAIAKEENADYLREFFLDQVKELEKEVQDRLGSSKATIPVNQEGARYLYVPLAGAHTIVPQAIILNAAKESWTLSMYDTANYAVFLGDIEKAKRIAGRIIREAETLKVEEMIITECGHGYTAMRWDVPKWFGKPLSFKVRNIIEVIDDYIRDNVLHFNPASNAAPVTYHDSCNLGRKGGLLEEPRRVIRAVVGDFREMIPNRLHSFCCGAGSGLVAEPEWTDIRLQAGKFKAEQIRQTGAEIVITSCDNCRYQIKELGEHYSLNTEVTSISELTANALI